MMGEAGNVPISNLGTTAALALGSGITAMVGAAQQVSIDQGTWIPLGVVIALTGTAIALTTKVVRLIDGIERRLKNNANDIEQVRVALEELKDASR